MEKIFKVGDLKRLVTESSNEFKAVLGPNVESDNKKNNGKAYTDAKKRAKDYDGGLEKEMLKDKPKFEKVDDNKTTLDYTPDNANDAYRKRVEAQVKGYTSELEQKNGLAKEGDFDGNENIYNGLKKAGKDMHKAEKDFKKSGLQAREYPDDVFEKNEMYESKDGFDMRNMIDKFRANAGKTVLKEHVKTIYFKKTQFLNEEHMFSRIPDEFKNEGEQFKMKDKTGNEYLLEWKYGTANIIGHSNKGGMNESLERMKSMYNYSPKDTETTMSYRINEGEEAFRDTLDKMRKIIK